MGETYRKIIYDPVLEFKNYFNNFFYVKSWSRLSIMTKQQMCI
jgi:hypothetical protein